MRNTIHLKLENGKITGRGKITNERLFEAFKSTTLEISMLDGIIEHFAYLNYWVETDSNLSNAKY